nr:putative ubiquitin-protein ligase [Tanacetum cinerariifolium]
VLLTSSDAVLSNLTPALVAEANMLGERRGADSKKDFNSSTTLLLLIASMETASETPIVQINRSANVKIKAVHTHTV